MRLLLLLLTLLPTTPNHVLTPGITRNLSVATICATTWGTDARHVTPAMRHLVIVSYHLTDADVTGHGVCCEIDHLVPRELGGADDVQNLWPQPWADAHVKDHAENRLHKAVCAGTLDLLEAQNTMRHWGQR